MLAHDESPSPPSPASSDPARLREGGVTIRRQVHGSVFRVPRRQHSRPNRHCSCLLVSPESSESLGWTIGFRPSARSTRNQRSSEHMRTAHQLKLSLGLSLRRRKTPVPTEYSVRVVGVAVASQTLIPFSGRMTALFVALLASLRVAIRSRLELAAEILALRHQLAVLQRATPKRPRLRPLDRLLWVLLSSVWPNWRQAVQIVTPATVVRWHRRAFAARDRSFLHRKVANLFRHTPSKRPRDP
jgi:hypothetical protein